MPMIFTHETHKDLQLTLYTDDDIQNAVEAAQTPLLTTIDNLLTEIELLHELCGDCLGASNNAH